MSRLGHDWITDGMLDFEYKKYVLLAYLQSVQKAFGKVRLYPSLAELVKHYNNTLDLKRNHSEFVNNLPKKLKPIDLKALRLEYQQMAMENDSMKEVESIIEFAIPLLKKSLEEGREIYEFVEGHCELTPVGLLPLYVDEGYLFINNTGKQYAIYRYEVSKIQAADVNYRAIRTELLTKLEKGIGETLESVKNGLVSQFKDLPNPATFAVIAKMKFPVSATLEPIAKRMLMRYISAA